MQEPKKSGVVFKVFFIIMLVFLVLGSIVYVPLKLSLTQAIQQETPPTLFGKMFIPYTVEGESPYSQIASGSLVFFESPADKDVEEGIVVLYPTPDGGSEQNVVFLTYSMGMVATMNDIDGIGETYGIMIGNDPNLELETIAATSVIGVGSSTMKQMAYLVEFATGTMGLVVLVLLPLTLFGLFLTLFLVTRGKRKKVTAPADTSPQSESPATPAPEVLQNLAIDEALIQQETASILTAPVSETTGEPQDSSPPQTQLISPDTTREELLQSVDLPSQSPAVSPEDALASMPSVAEHDPAPHVDTQTAIENFTMTLAKKKALDAEREDHDAVVPEDLTATQETEIMELVLPASQENESGKAENLTPLSLDDQPQEGDAMDLQQNFFEELKELSNPTPRVDLNNTLDEEAFLAKIEEDLNRIEQEVQGHEALPSMTLEPTPLPDLHLTAETSAKEHNPSLSPEENSIVFLLKDEEMDVKFNHLVSNNINIDYHKDGSGFLIKTPKYQADITVVISEQ